MFTPGARYRAKKAFGAGERESFTAGEVLTFVSSTYSFYDGCEVYRFENADGAGKEWWATARERAFWSDYFEAVGGPAEGDALPLAPG
jgi:hypothetical protein